MQNLRPETGMIAFISCGKYQLINRLDLLFGVGSQHFFTQGYVSKRGSLLEKDTDSCDLIELVIVTVQNGKRRIFIVMVDAM